MDATILVNPLERSALGELSLPDYFVYEVQGEKYFIQRYLCIVTDVDTKVNIQGAGLSQQLAKKGGRLRKPSEIPISRGYSTLSILAADAPSIPLSLLLQHRGFFLQRSEERRVGKECRSRRW